LSTENGLVRWKCWYWESGKITDYDSDISVWNELPTEGLQLLIKYIEREGGTIRCVLQGQDAYILTRAEWKKSPKKNTPNSAPSALRRNSISLEHRQWLKKKKSSWVAINGL